MMDKETVPPWGGKQSGIKNLGSKVGRRLFMWLLVFAFVPACLIIILDYFPTIHFSKYYLVITLGFLLFVAFSALIVSRYIAAPIINLTRTVGDIVGGDMNAQFNIKSEDEIGQLAGSFSKMIVSLRRSYKDLEDKTKGLSNSLLQAEEQRRDLEDAKIAMLNIMDDLDSAKEELEREKTALISVMDDLEQAKSKLERSNQELEQFAYIASHDLQEPLRMVASYTELLEKRYVDKLDDKAKEFVNFAVEGAQRMQALINDLLTYSRVTTRAKEFLEIDMNDVIKKVLDNLQIAIKEKEAVVRCSDLPKIMGDDIQLMQLLQNLIANALKFCKDRKPEVEISCESKDLHWVFSVRDNGIGIEKEYADKVFEIFQRLHTRDQYEGTGIGLAVCKKIAERHGGRIWLESELGSGTTFYFSVSKAVM